MPFKHSIVALLLPLALPALVSSAKADVPAGSAPASAVSAHANDASVHSFGDYLQQMRAPINQYLKIMLDLVPLVEPPYDASDKNLRDDHVEVLNATLGSIAPTTSVAVLHGQLRETLERVEVFMNAGGLSKVGFSKALSIAEQMHDISDKYHAALLKQIEADKLSRELDPFLVTKVKPHSVQTSSAKKTAQPVDDGDDDESDGEGNVHRSSSKNFSTGGYGRTDSHFVHSSMINGVGGSMGMSGLFNGLGGTGTNGLVDGYGFSSGLNGYVNGTGLSTGTSGFMNDINVMSPSSGNSRSGW